MNMVPFLELGGYCILSDLLERPQLRSESWKALSEALKFRRSRELWLADYGASSVVFGIGLLGSRLIDGQSQKMTVAARARAERKVLAHLS